jgi:hypothetical protein
LAARVSLVSDVLGVHVDASKVPTAALLAGNGSALAQTSPGDAALVIRYARDVNDLRVAIQGEVTATGSGARIGADSAKVIANGVLALLDSKGVIRTVDHADQPRISTVMTRGGQDEVMTSEVANEYRFTYVRSINSTPFPNAGVGIYVSAFGKVRLVRVGGAEVSSRRDAAGKELPLSGIDPLRLDVDEATARLRFQNEHPNAKILKSTLSYTFDSTRTKIEPRLLVDYYDAFAVGENTAASRQLSAGYPLRVGGVPVSYAPAVSAGAPGGGK